MDAFYDGFPALRKFMARYYTETQYLNQRREHRYHLGEVLAGKLDKKFIWDCGLDERFGLSADYGIQRLCSIMVELPDTGEEVLFVVDLSKCWGEKVILETF